LRDLRKEGELGVVIHAYNPITALAEASRSQVPDQPGIHSGTLFLRDVGWGRGKKEGRKEANPYFIDTRVELRAQRVASPW
jgi:hypothetical protein